MDRLGIASFLGTNTVPVIKAVANYLNRHLQIPVDFLDYGSWEEEGNRFVSGEFQLGWMCGLEYVRQAADRPGNVELLAAPIFCGNRYKNQPVYFSDIVVRAGSPFHTFAHLRGATWVYNERRSYSGYYLVDEFLAHQGEDASYFAQLLEAGSHKKSLSMVLDGQADMAAIDSTILDFELARNPELVNQIRMIRSLGPSPVPPWVISYRLPLEWRREIRKLVLEMGKDPVGASLLEEGDVGRFSPVDDSDYNPIRRVAKLVDQRSDTLVC